MRLAAWSVAGLAVAVAIAGVAAGATGGDPNCPYYKGKVNACDGHVSFILEGRRYFIRDGTCWLGRPYNGARGFQFNTPISAKDPLHKHTKSFTLTIDNIRKPTAGWEILISTGDGDHYATGSAFGRLTFNRSRYSGSFSHPGELSGRFAC